MSFTPLGRLKTIEAFEDYLLAQGEESTFCDRTLEAGEGPLGRPLQLSLPLGGSRTIGNRFCVHPMEGWDGTEEGAPT